MLERVLEPEVMDSPEEAEGYDAMDHREPNEAFVNRLLELGARGRMLDLGTGPGDIPLLIAGRTAEAEITGVDLARSMLALAERKRAVHPAGGRVRFQVADAKELPFGDGAFDTVFSNTILHHIPDPRPFLREAWRVLKPGGVLLIRDLMRPSDRATLDRLVALHASDCDPLQRDLFRASLHAAFRPGEVEALAAECGLEGIEVVVDSDRHLSLQGRRPGPA